MFYRSRNHDKCHNYDHNESNNCCENNCYNCYDHYDTTWACGGMRGHVKYVVLPILPT